MALTDLGLGGTGELVLRRVFSGQQGKGRMMTSNGSMAFFNDGNAKWKRNYEAEGAQKNRGVIEVMI